MVDYKKIKNLIQESIYLLPNNFTSIYAKQQLQLSLLEINKLEKINIIKNKK